MWIPAYSTITVKQSNGQALPNTSVYLVDSTMSYRFNTELLTTGSDGKVQYCIPNKLRATDMAYMCVASQYDTANSVDVIGHAGVYYGGFFHKSALFSNASNGLSLSITMPQSSVATVKKYNAPKANQAVYIADENLTQIISDGALSTNSNGTVAFSIPTGTRFRYYVQDTNGSVFYSDALTAPSSAEIKMIAHNEPSLTAPNDQTSYDVSAAVNFSWGAVQNATDYLWLYRHSSASNWAGWYTGGDRFLNGVSFGTTGTWYWFVQALDVNGNVIAQSATRTLTTTNAPVSQRSMQPQSTDDSNLMREQADNMLAIPKKTGLRSVAGLDSIELDVPSMELSGKIRAFEEKAAVTVRHIAELDPQNALDSDAVVIDMPEIKIPLYNELYQVKSLNKEELENALQDDDSMVDEFEEWDESDFYLDWLYGYGFDDSSHEGNCPCEEDHEPAFEDEDLLLEEELLLEEYF
ncbi:MAG TPA: hypothetical protein DEB39_06385 [Planctomycetaceae bacterium]|nr:hypothetical protein [Planctomycetaceae bacterium]